MLFLFYGLSYSKSLLYRICCLAFLFAFEFGKVILYCYRSRYGSAKKQSIYLEEALTEEQEEQEDEEEEDGGLSYYQLGSLGVLFVWFVILVSQFYGLYSFSTAAGCHHQYY